MILLASLLAGGRRAALLFALVAAALLAPASTAQAQRLLTLVSGTAEAASVGGLGPSIGPVPTAVQVDLELLRGAPARLEVPTPDGSVLSAEQSVFEDRGGGDLMWSGGQPDAGYDTVVLTVEGGRLVGRFGAAGGGVYQIHSERNGRGGMSPVIGPSLDEESSLCAVEMGAQDAHDAHAHLRTRVFAAALPERVSDPQRHDRLDILVAYTAKAAENWADRGGALAAIRHAGDYLKMVFRNNDLPVEPHIVHVAQASAALDRAGRDLRVPRSGLFNLMVTDGTLRRLKHRHRADLVHVFTGEGPALLGNPCGQHSLLSKGDTARSGPRHGWTSNGGYCDYVTTFVHEIGHGLGANHEPLATKYPHDVYWPYSFALRNGDVVPSIGTATMTGVGQVEPFFSTPRLRPYGAVVGIAGSQDNERTLRETVHIGARYSRHLRSLEGVPAQPTDFRVWRDGDSAHLAWQDNAPGADGYNVWYAGRNPSSGWNNLGTTVPVEGRTGATIPLEHTAPGTVYLFDVQATKGEDPSLWSLEAGWVWLAIPDDLEAPSDVSVAASGRVLDVRWADNSDNEDGFVVHVLDDGEPVARKWATADRTEAEILGFRIRPHGGEYQVRVYAANYSGYSEGSEAVTFRWASPLAPPAVSDLAATAIGPTTVRVTWTGNSESDGYWVRASAPGWLYTVHVDTEWVDIEGLARGGRYTFEVAAVSEEGAQSVPSRAYLTLGARGTGPAAPSNLAWVPEGDEGHWARVSWKDNSRDELGFEVRSGSFRLAIVPPDTESAVVPVGHLRPGFGGVRVYAYNERGFSARSRRVSSGPGLQRLIATAGDTKAKLRWDMWSAEAVTGMQARWKATADLPFDDAVDAWTDLPAFARAYTVTGLRNGTKYTFAVRYVTASGAGSAVTVRARPRDLPLAPPEAAFTVSVDCSGDPCRVGTGEVIGFVDTSSGNVTQRHWSFGDGATSELKSLTHAWSRPGFYDVTLTVGDGSSSNSAARTLLVEVPAPGDPCRADTETLCLQDSRFEVKVNWWSADGESGPGQVVEDRTDDSGLFRFFGADNWEILIKVLDGCEINGRMWVLGASTTDLGYRIVVTDTVTGESRSYENEPGRPAPAIVDTEAFALPCGDGAGP